MRNLFKNKLNLLYALFMAGSFTACHEQTLFHAYQSLPKEGWLKRDTLLYQVEMTDSSSTSCQLMVEVRNQNNYPYQNLALYVECLSPDSLSLFSRKMAFTLCDEEGKWKGIGMGNLYQSTQKAGDLSTPRTGLYTFKVSYVFPDSCLVGLSDIGIHLKR